MDWHSPPADLILEPGQVHLWWASLDASPAELIRAAARLAADEHGRTGRFHFERDRRRYTVARAGLRRLLGRYLSLDPASVPITYGENGKPQLSASAGSDLTFNLSHAGDAALLAFTRGYPLGVDLEQERPIPEWEQIVASYFTPAEATALIAVPSAEYSSAFLTIWTLQEAFGKATGRGLGEAAAGIGPDLMPDQWAHLLNRAGTIESAAGWTYWSGVPAAGYVAALATPQPAPTLLCWLFED